MYSAISIGPSYMEKSLEEPPYTSFFRFKENHLFGDASFFSHTRTEKKSTCSSIDPDVLP